MLECGEGKTHRHTDGPAQYTFRLGYALRELQLCIHAYIHAHIRFNKKIIRQEESKATLILDLRHNETYRHTIKCTTAYTGTVQII